MLGIYYLILSGLVGYMTCSLAFPKLKNYTQTTYKGRKIGIPSEFLLFPSSFVVGSIMTTWITYIIGYLARDSKSPLKLANMVAIPFFTLLCLIFYSYRYYKGMKENKNISLVRSQTKDQDFNGYRVTKGELVYLFLAAFISVFLMFYTFYIIDNKLHVGFTVYSDFSPHIGMIRSFSKGNNFPTQYTFFAGEDIRYHFMFFFLVANLEFLGLRLDYAFNIPSVMGLISTYLLLYILVVKITDKRRVGFLAGLLFTFRSSPSFFCYLAKKLKESNIMDSLINNTEFIGYTPRENWGLWNLNVYVNQRHFPFSISLLLLVIILFLPNLYKMFQSFDKERRPSIKNIFFTGEGWLIRDYKLAVFAGIIAGLTAFWNGASLIALLSILFLMAVISSNRLEYLVTALIATGLSLVQSGFFVKGSPVSPKFYFGFIVENPSILNVLVYIFKLLGVLPLLLILAFVIKKGVDRYIMFAFLAPSLITFTLSLTPDVTVNHKYLMISIMLLGIYAADLISKLIDRKALIYKGLALVLILLVTSTGFYDFTTLISINTRSVKLDLNNEITKWIEENADSQDVFLTAPYALNQVVLAGPSLYQGWPYFAWSAGYDTHARDKQVRLMYEADSHRELEALVRENNIRFIIVDRENRISNDYILNEDNIRQTFQCVFEIGEGEYKTSIYDTSKPIK